MSIDILRYFSGVQNYFENEINVKMIYSFFKVHLTPSFFSAEMKLCNIYIKNEIILSVSGIFKGFKN